MSVDYQIITFDPTSGVGTIGIPTVQKKITGLNLLLQVVALSYLRNPGKSIFFPTEGSGLRIDLGQYNYGVTGQEVQTLAVQRTRAVQQEVISRQDPNQGTPSERLSSLTLQNFAFNASTGQSMLQVQILSEAGETQDILV